MDNSQGDLTSRENNSSNAAVFDSSGERSELCRIVRANLVFFRFHQFATAERLRRLGQERFAADSPSSPCESRARFHPLDPLYFAIGPGIFLGWWLLDVWGIA